MANFGFEADFSDVNDFFDDCRHQVRQLMDEVGADSVEYARQTGSYTDRTGNLRRSNRYENDGEALTLINDADYASNVEARGYTVLTAAALYAEKRLRDDNGN
jgi:hypothetical protein